MLAGLTHLASKPEGASQLFTTLNKLDPGLLGNFSSLLGSQGTAVTQQGGSLLNGLFGSGMIASLVGVLAKFTGLGQGSANSLISMLAPLFLGMLSKQSQVKLKSFLGWPQQPIVPNLAPQTVQGDSR